MQGAGLTLLGRNWLRHIRLNWGQISINSVAVDSSLLSTLKKNFLAIFDEDLGTVRAHKAKLSVTKEAKPRFYGPRPVP